VTSTINIAEQNNSILVKTAEPMNKSLSVLH